MKDFPNSGWAEKQLGEVVTVTKTKGGSRPLPYVGLEDISSDGTGEFTGSLVPQGDKSTTFEFGPRHLLYGRLRPYLNKVYRPDFEGHCSSEIFPMLPDECLDRGYLFHWITSDQVVEKINATSTGARMPRANVKEILQFPIPLPPLEEQQRIVAVLDEAFEGLARARAHAEANLQNARELFESAVEAALERAGGEPVSLQEMMDTGMITSHLDGNHGSDYPRKAEFVSEGVPYISANCIADNEIDFGRCKYLTLERASGLRKGVAKNRDVLFAHNATVGPVTLLKTEEEKVILSTSLTYYRCNESELIPEFLVCEMRSAGFRRQYEAVMAQATRNQVPITMQRKFTHLIPPIAEQRRIAELGVELEAKCNSAEKAYEASLKDLDDLRQSLLQKAFAGELT